MLKKKLIVIGAGPGGYAAAFLAADLGIDATLIDSEKNPGGVCLYRLSLIHIFFTKRKLFQGSESSDK